MPAADDAHDHFCSNVRYLASLHRLKQVALAKELGWDRTVLAKFMSGQRKPSISQKVALATVLRTQVAELELDHATFRARLEGDRTRSDMPLLTFRTTIESARRWQHTFEKYRGQYLIYYKHVVDGIVIASLLTIDRLTNDGLYATLTNPHKDSSGSTTAFEYAGYAYPVREYIYFLLEQKNANYEILSVILHEARTPTINVLRGLLSGIGVDKEVSYIAARPLVALRLQRRIDDWRAAVGKELGYLPLSGIRQIARQHLSDEKITVL